MPDSALSRCGKHLRTLCYHARNSHVLRKSLYPPTNGEADDIWSRIAGRRIAGSEIVQTCARDNAVGARGSGDSRRRSPQSIFR